MYPDFHYLVKGLLGLDLPFLSIIKTFGFLVAMGFIVGGAIMKKELKRKRELGYFKPEIVNQKDKKTGKMVQQIFYPEDRVVDIIFIAAIAGFVGAKLFNAFETWEDFVSNPLGNLLSPAGLTFYGGLICATLALYIYSKKKKFSFKHLCDAAAPALLIAYGVGRLGCQMAGDGDWGIFNSAYVTEADGSLVAASPKAYDSIASKNAVYFQQSGFEQAQIPHKYIPAGFLPRWMVAQNYKNNVNNDGIQILGDDGEYNRVLPVAVFPTPIYETIACTLLFGLLWLIRRRIDVPLRMFGIYLILNGLERFFVEQIRVNYKYDWGFIHPTQAEIIAVGLMLAGFALLIFMKKKAVILETPKTNTIS